MGKEKLSDHFFRLGIAQSMKDDIEKWRVAQLEKTGKVPSFSEATRQLVQRGLDIEIIESKGAGE